MSPDDAQRVVAFPSGRDRSGRYRPEWPRCGCNGSGIAQEHALAVRLDRRLGGAGRRLHAGAAPGVGLASARRRHRRRGPVRGARRLGPPGPSLAQPARFRSRSARAARAEPSLRHRDQQHVAGPVPLRRRPAPDRLQPSLRRPLQAAARAVPAGNLARGDRRPPLRPRLESEDGAGGVLEVAQRDRSEYRTLGHDRRAERRSHDRDPPRVDAGRRLGRDPRRHHRAPARRDADRTHGAPRCAHRTAEPGLLQAAPRAAARRPRERPIARRAVHRPRPLQGDQRHPRSSGRRRAPARRGGPARRVHTRNGPCRPVGRRRVRHRPGRRAATCSVERAGGAPGPFAGRALRHRGAPGLDRRQHRHGALTRSRRPARRGDEARRPRPLRGQGRRRRAGAAVRYAHGRSRSRARHSRSRPAPRRRGRRARACHYQPIFDLRRRHAP